MGVPLDDRGFLLGDGLFETVLWEDGRLQLFEPHAARLQRGCATLGLPAPEPGRLAEAAQAAIAAANLQAARAAVRLTWTAGGGGRGLDRPGFLQPRLYATAAPAPRPTGAAVLATAGVRRNPSSPTARLKTLSYLDGVAARAEARAAGADEALMLNVAGEVASAAAANLFWFEGARLLTPDLACGVLDGVMRAEVLKAAQAAGIEAAEVRAPAAALAAAEGLFLTNSLIGVRPVTRLDGREVAPRPETAVLAAAIT